MIPSPDDTWPVPSPELLPRDGMTLPSLGAAEGMEIWLDESELDWDDDSEVEWKEGS